MKRIVLNLSLFFFFLFLLPVTVFADSGKTEAVWTKERLDSEIKILNEEYRSNLQDYRDKEKLYQISYDQHQSLQTLATIEDLIQKAKTLGLSRDEVLLDYLELLKLNLISTEGVELSLKDLYLERIDIVLEYITMHRDELETLTEREEIQKSLTDFTNTHKNMPNFTNSVLVLLSTGNLQMIFDKSVVLKSDIDSFLEEQDLMKKSEVLRASTETAKAIDSSQQLLKEFWDDITKKVDNSSSLSSVYNNLNQELDPVYVSISKLLSYLGELIKI